MEMGVPLFQETAISFLGKVRESGVRSNTDIRSLKSATSTEKKQRESIRNSVVSPQHSGHSHSAANTCTLCFMMFFFRQWTRHWCLADGIPFARALSLCQRTIVPTSWSGFSSIGVKHVAGAHSISHEQHSNMIPINDPCWVHGNAESVVFSLNFCVSV